MHHPAQDCAAVHKQAAEPANLAQFLTGTRPDRIVTAS
jgi:hypothetical protein